MNSHLFNVKSFVNSGNKRFNAEKKITGETGGSLDLYHSESQRKQEWAKFHRCRRCDIKGLNSL